MQILFVGVTVGVPTYHLGCVAELEGMADPEFFPSTEKGGIRVGKAAP